MKTRTFDAAIIGCGSTGIATAYYLARNHSINNVALIDCGQPMAFTSAQSGENYRNWWPHPVMVDFTNRSIDLMEEIARDTGNRINMNRRGYALVTREKSISALVEQLQDSMGEASELVRIHESALAPSYQRPERPDWDKAPVGVDILRSQSLIRSTFPSFATDIQSVVHIRRGGDISGQQLGMYMLEYLKESGACRITGTVEAIRSSEIFTISVRDREGINTITAHNMINAAGPFASDVAQMLGVQLPVYNTFQQKIAFDDQARAIPRNMPFSIDLDSQDIDWQDDERDMLLNDSDYRWLAQTMPGSIHCRPDGGDLGSWVKLGWAYNQQAIEATRDLPLDEHFPDIVLRGASRLNPSLKTYYGKLPRSLHHYGGWYTMTDENWPLIGPMNADGEPDGAFMNCALSGFGTMAACAGGELCAAWVAGAELPEYAGAFSLERHSNSALMQQLLSKEKGIL